MSVQMFGGLGKFEELGILENPVPWEWALFPTNIPKSLLVPIIPIQSQPGMGNNVGINIPKIPAGSNGMSGMGNNAGIPQDEGTWSLPRDVGITALGMWWDFWDVLGRIRNWTELQECLDDASRNILECPSPLEEAGMNWERLEFGGNSAAAFL